MVMGTVGAELLWYTPTEFWFWIQHQKWWLWLLDNIRLKISNFRLDLWIQPLCE